MNVDKKVCPSLFPLLFDVADKLAARLMYKVARGPRPFQCPH